MGRNVKYAGSEIMINRKLQPKRPTRSRKIHMNMKVHSEVMTP
jgi:hypothetical protein